MEPSDNFLEVRLVVGRNVTMSYHEVDQGYSHISDKTSWDMKPLTDLLHSSS